MTLVFYQKEGRKFKLAYSIKLNEKASQIVFGKLKRHFKLTRITLQFDNRVKEGQFAEDTWIITIREKSNMGVIIHEVAHALQQKKEGLTKHDKQMMETISKVYHYTKSKRFWKKELSRRVK
jgi:hypothetical protein